MTTTSSTLSSTASRASVLTIENALYAVLVLVALSLRLYGLGEQPLPAGEAREALHAWRFVNGVPDVGAPLSASYTALTVLGFFLFGDGAAVARLAPALAGAALVLVPWLYRRVIGRAPALIASGLLAVSSTLVAASRSADGAVLAVLGLSAAVGFVVHGWGRANPRPWWLAAAGALGLAMASGPQAVTGLVLLAITAALMVMLLDPFRRDHWERWLDVDTRTTLRGLRVPLAAAVIGVMVLIATLALVYRPGFAALAASPTAWLGGFTRSTLLDTAVIVDQATTRNISVVWVWLAHSDPALLFGGLFGISLAFIPGGLLNPDTRAGLQALATFALAGLVFSLIYPGREPIMAVWIVTPLALLLATGLWQAITTFNWREEWLSVVALTAILIALLAFTTINLAGAVETLRTQAQEWPWPQDLNGWRVTPFSALGLAVAGVLMSILIVILFGMGWSYQAAAMGTVLALVGFTLVNGLNASWSQAHLQADRPTELWVARPANADLNRIVATLEEIAANQLGDEHALEIVAQAPADGALAWALRDFRQTRFVDGLDSTVTAQAVIAPLADEPPALGASYLGQPFTLETAWTPDSLVWNQRFVWWMARRAPITAEQMAVYVRTDVQMPTVPGE